MKISILTLFPEMFQGPFDYSIVNNAINKNKVEIEFVNIRDFGVGRHKVVDDTEYGGGVGMVMKVDVLHEAIKYAKKSHKSTNKKVILLSATGKTYNQKIAKELSVLDHLILVCGHYEGVDERIKKYIDSEISIGDFVITGGEIPAMILTDSVVRLISGVLPEKATEDESFSEIQNITLLEYPHYTKPREFKNHIVPDVLLSGDHPKISAWRKKSAMNITQKLRPDLIKQRDS